MSGRTFPTLYAMGAIGVTDTLEAIEAFHFCTVGCREAYEQATAPYTDGGWLAGAETLSIDGAVCEQCGAALDEGATA